ncbi:hypothetical protein GGR56DRAFT_275554 [Xylariaceae sp. FL0804]|nr:hypothetical protein GGR56DRAFT_275554 [Xylariaceae sp. FL0804]
MSGLEGLGLACSIFQVVSFAREVISVARKIYHDGAFDASLDEKASYLNSVAASIPSQRLSPAQSPEYQQLFDVSRSCREAAEALRREVTRISTTSTTGTTRTICLTVKAIRGRRKIEKLEQKLAQIERVMQTGLLERTFQATHDIRYDTDSLGNDLRHFVIQYQNGHRDTANLVSTEAVRTRNLVVEEAVRTRDHIEASRRHDGLAESCTRLLRSFKYYGMEERRNQIRPSHESTLQWIFRAEHSPNDEWGPNIKWHSFSAWLESKDTADWYWISGKPGSGKTTLVKYILAQPQTRACLGRWETSHLIISHFIWKLGPATHQKTFKGLLCSLVYQLLEKDTSQLESLLRRSGDVASKDSDADWSEEHLRDLLLSLAEQYVSPICIFLDGLDELEPQDDSTKVFDVADALRRTGRVKVCLASRPEPSLKMRLRFCPTLRLQDLNAGDISRYVHETLTFSENDLSEGDKQEIVQLIVDKSEGVFLWSRLVIHNLNRGLALGDNYDLLRSRIHNLPSDLAKLYQDMWTRMNENDPVYRKDAAKILKVVLALHKLEGDMKRHPRGLFHTDWPGSSKTSRSLQFLLQSY